MRAIKLDRAISTGQLSALPHLHIQPINVVVFHGSQGSTRFEVGFPLRCLQRLSRPIHSYPALRLAPQQVHQRYVHPGPLVLGTDPLNTPTPTADRDRTVSRRSEPSSRTTLIGEQPNPWDLLQPQDVMSRHRGAKRPVDMDSWGSSACYPRRTFYPLSDGPSTRDHRITMTDFRLCSTCPSRSQAGLCHCTQRAISDRSEPTIARLRYSLGGDRPSQTAHHALSRIPDHGPRLDNHIHKGGISRTAPPGLAPTLQSLPPILHMPTRMPAQSYSKGARGLSV